LSDTQVKLDWTDASTDETNFKVERANESAPGSGVPGAFAQVGSLVPPSPGTGGAVTFTDANASPNTLYFYQVKALNTFGASTPAGPVQARTLPSRPVPPSNLTAAVVNGNQVTITFRDNSNNETGF